MATRIQHNAVSGRLQPGYQLSTQPHSSDPCSFLHPSFTKPSSFLKPANPVLSQSRSRSSQRFQTSSSQLPCNHHAAISHRLTDTSPFSNVRNPSLSRATRAGRRKWGVRAATGGSEAGPSGQGGPNASTKRGGPAASSLSNPVLRTIDTALRLVLVKLLLVLHKVLSLGLAVIRAVWRGWPVKAVRNTVNPVIYGEEPLTTPWFLKPVELALRIVLFFVPGFVKRRVGPVLHAVVSSVGERLLALVRKGAKQGLGGVREWGQETARMSEDGAPEARRVFVQIVYRLLQFYAFTVFVENLPGLSETAFSVLGWMPRGVATLWRWAWAVIDYTLLDMDWVQPLQRLIVEVVWPFWRDYWILAAVCTVVWERLHPTLLTEADIYGEPIWVDE